MTMHRIVVESGEIKIVNQAAYRNPAGDVLVLDEGQLPPVGHEHFVPDPNPQPTPEQIKSALSAAVQTHMDAAAKAAGYDDIKSAVTYAEEPAVAKFQAEGQAFRAWRSLCWAKCYEVLAAVEAGERPIPELDEIIAELPELAP